MRLELVNAFEATRVFLVSFLRSQQVFDFDLIEGVDTVE